MASSKPSSTKGIYRSLPKDIWVLGFVSMFMDISSELVHSLLPIFMVTTLGASMITIGILEGIAEGSAAIMKVFSGAISDYFRKRKILAVIGYGLGAMTKPIFPLATTIGWVFGARFVDRIGKGIRGAPRDALVGALFTLARFSEAFLILRAQDVGLAIGYVPTIMIVMNVAYSLFAYPAGAAADVVSARTLLFFGLGLLVIADVILAIAASPGIAFLGSAFWGLHMAFTQGLLSKLVADNAPAELRGTAFGIFNLISGGALLLASAIAGAIWNAFGAPATFTTGALLAALSATGLLLYRPNTTRHEA
jgi:MFS family permease